MSLPDRILIIDDEPEIRNFLCRLFTDRGYGVVEAANGQMGLDLFKQAPCSLVITDMVMPIKDGLQTILDLRKNYPELPVIAISGGGTISKERYLTVASYLDGVKTIAKPFSLEEIVDAVQELLGKKEEE